MFSFSQNAPVTFESSSDNMFLPKLPQKSKRRTQPNNPLITTHTLSVNDAGRELTILDLDSNTRTVRKYKLYPHVRAVPKDTNFNRDFMPQSCSVKNIKGYLIIFLGEIIQVFAHIL